MECSGALEWNEGELRGTCGGGEWRGSGGELEVAEDAADGREVGDEGEDPAARAAGVTGEDIDAEGAAEEFGPGEAASGRGARRELRRSGGLGGWRCRLGRSWDDARAQVRVGSEHPVEPGEVEPGRRNEGGEFAEELERGEDEVGGAVWGGPLAPGRNPPTPSRRC